MPTASNTLANPFDFRRPIDHRDRLIGRDEELARLEQFMDETGAGRPVHVALVGERAAGKTSLLNMLEQRAKSHGLLPVRLDLDEDVVSSPFSFFYSLFDACLQACISNGVLKNEDSRYSAWIRQAYQGDLDVPPGEQLLLFGSLVAGAKNGRPVSDVTPAMLSSDLNAIAGLLPAAELSGVVLLIDEGDLLGQQHALMQKMRNLLQNSTNWMLITAGTDYMFEGISEVFSPIPRQFARQDVRPLEALWEVIECVEKPLETLGVDRGELMYTADFAQDLFSITQGRPYEINLVCFHIWEELRESSQRPFLFELSPGVLDKVIEELQRLGRDVGGPEIDVIRRLDEEDFEVLADLVPCIGMTPRQVAMTQLLADGFTAQELNARVHDIEDSIGRAAFEPLLDTSTGMLHLLGGDFAQVYLRYAALRHTRTHRVHQHEGQRSFGAVVVDVLSRPLLEVFGRFDPHESTRPEVIIRSREFGDAEVTADTERTARAIKDRDIPRLSNPGQPLFFLRLFTSPRRNVSTPNDAGGRFWISLVWNVELELLEQQVHIPLVDGRTTESVRADVLQWIADISERLSAAGGRLELMAIELIDPHLVAAGTAFIEQTNLAIGDLWTAFFAGHYSEAVAICAKAVAAFREYQPVVHASDRSQPQIRAYDHRIGDWLNRFGFTTACFGDTRAAAAIFTEALEVSDETWIVHFNLAYAASCDGEYELAATHLRESLIHIEQDRSAEQAHLLIFLPGVHSSVAEDGTRTNLSYVDSRRQLEQLIDAQLWAAEMLQGKHSFQEFLEWFADSPHEVSALGARVLLHCARAVSAAKQEIAGLLESASALDGWDPVWTSELSATQTTEAVT